jgi:hypothetical protein
MDHPLTVHVDQAPRGISQLPKSHGRQCRVGVAGVRAENLQGQTDSHQDVPLQTG